jgi:DNA-binding transcriptional LysR family regulator
VLSSANTALQLVPQAIARLGAQAPGSRVYFETLPTREIIRRLVAEEADLAISSAPIDHPALDARPIGEWSLICALPASHPLARARRPRLEHVLRERLIVYSPQAPQSGDIERWLSQHGIARNVAVGAIVIRSAMAAAGMVWRSSMTCRAHGRVLKFPAVRRHITRGPGQQTARCRRWPPVAGPMRRGWRSLQDQPIVRASLVP